MSRAVYLRVDLFIIKRIKKEALIISMLPYYFCFVYCESAAISCGIASLFERTTGFSLSMMP